MDEKIIFSDAWLLASILSADRGQGCSIAEIITTGDALNHAVFTQQELTSGLNKLSSLNFVELKDGKVVSREKLSKIAGETSIKKKSSGDKISRLERLLVKELGSARGLTVSSRWDDFIDMNYDQAVSDYQKRLRKL